MHTHPSLSHTHIHTYIPVDLMDESAVRLSQLSVSMSRVDEKVAETNTAISKFENLKKVQNVKENLQKVIEQVEFFAKVCMYVCM